MFVTLWRMITFGFQNFFRNIWLSLITVLIVVLNLFLMSLVSGLNVVGQQTLTAVRQKVDLSVYFIPTTSEQRVDQIRQELLRKPEVQSIRLITRAEHLQELKKSAVDKGLVDAAIDALGDNPLGAGLVITSKTLDGYGAIANTLKDPKYQSIIEDTGNNFQTNQTVISRLSLIVNRVQVATLWLTLLFAVIAILMVFNTIRVAIYSQREEIGIMKLVGASDAFVRGPFVITSLLYGLVASILVTAVLVPILSLTNPFFAQFFAGYDINVLGYVREHLWTILGLEVAVGCGLSVISSLFAIGRYLRV
ncbi:MAG: ABC transporter permease [Candidatus Kerfeldbacteria bacterium]|nr:ABC transporter permease [Candidatus Kerfeldbacteria bacterium]